jgi:hypothetical protein
MRIQYLKLTTFVSITLSYIVITSSSLLAQSSASGAVYARQAIGSSSATFSGGFYRNVAGNEDLYLFQRNPVDSISKQQYAAKTMWLIGPSSDNWIEAGSLSGWTSVDGNTTNTTFWKGNYYAKEDNGVYKRFFIGSQNATGNYTFQLDRGSQSGSVYNWALQVKSASGASLSIPITHSKNAFSEMQVGIETGNACNGFRSGTYADSLHFKDSGGFKTWSTLTSVVNTDKNNNTSVASRSSSYNKTGNFVTYGYQKNINCS